MSMAYCYHCKSIISTKEYNEHVKCDCYGNSYGHGVYIIGRNGLVKYGGNFEDLLIIRDFDEGVEDEDNRD